MRRLNVKLIMILIVSTVALLVGVHVLHGVQVDKNADVTLKQAEDRRGNGDLKAALKLYDQYVRQAPEEVEGYYERAKLALEIADLPGATDGDKEVAFRNLQLAAQRKSGDGFIHKNLARFEMSAIGNPIVAKSAEKNLILALEADPDDLDLAVKLAMVRMSLGERDKAFEQLVKMAGYDPAKKTFASPQVAAPLAAYYHLATILAKRTEKPDPAAAQATIAEMLATHPNDAQAYLQYAEWISSQEAPARTESAEVRTKWQARVLAAIDKAAELDPNDKVILILRLEKALERNDLELAKKLVEQGLKLHSLDRRVYVLGSQLKTREGKRDEAIALLQSGAKLLPSAIEIQYELAQLLFANNQADDAKKVAETVRELARQTSNHFQRLRSSFLQAQIAAMDNKLPQAESLLEAQRRDLELNRETWPRQGIAAPIDVFKQLGNTHRALAQVHAQRGAWDRALPHYELWGTYDQRNSVFARAGYLQTLAKLGHTNAALKEYRQHRTDRPEVFYAFDVLWRPALQLLLEQQKNLPAGKQSWAEIDEMRERIAKSTRLTLKEKEEIDVAISKAKGNTKESREQLASLLAENEKNESAWIQLVMLDLKEKGFDVASQTLATAVAKVGDTANLRLLKGNLLVQKNSPTVRRDLADLEKGLDKFEAKSRTDFYKAMSALYYHALRDVTEAQRLMHEALKLDSNDTRIQWSLFEYAREREDKEAVATVADKMKEMQGTNSTDWKLVEGTRLLLEMMKNGKPDASNMAQIRTLLLQIAELRPRWFEANWLEANVAFLEGNTETYVERLLETLRNGPANPRIVQRVVPLLIEKGQIDKAEATLKLIADEQRGPELRQLGVDLQLAKGNTTGAFEEAKVAIEGSKSDWRQWLWYGGVMTQLGKPDEAGTALQKAVELAPREADAQLALVQHYVRIDPTKEKAKQQLQTMEVQLGPERRAFALGIGHFILGDARRAEEYFREAKIAEPKSVGLQRAIAQFYLMRRDSRAKALDELNSLVAMESKPTDEANIRWARRQLAQLQAASGAFYQQQKALELLEQNRVDGVLSEDDLLQKARIFASRPDSDSRRKAIAIMERDFVRSNRPLSLNEQLMLASLYEQVGDWGKSGETIRRIASLPQFKDNTDVMTLYVKLALKHDDLQVATAWQSALEKIEPNKDVTKALKAQLLFKQKKSTQALNILRDMVPKPVTKENAALAMRIAEVMVTLKFYDDAENLYQEYVRVIPDAKLMYADFLGRYKSLQQCLDICEEMLKGRDPGRDSNDWMKVMEVAIYTLRARQSQVSPEQMEKVASWIKRGCNANPDSLEFRLKSAEFLELLGKYDEVAKQYRAILALPVKKGAADAGVSPELRAIALNNLAYLLALKEPPQTDEAEVMVTEAIGIYGPVRDLLDTRGLIYLRQGKVKEALADFNDVLLDHNARDLEDRTFGLKYFHMALAQFMDNDLTAAEKSMSQVDRLKLEPKDIPFGERPHFNKLRADMETKQKSRNAETAKN